MNRYMLNLYVPIIKGDEGYIIGGDGLYSVDSKSVVSLDEKQETFMQALLRGETKTQEELQAGLGEDVCKFFTTHGLFVTTETDTKSIYSRNKAYYYFNNMGDVQKKLATKSVLILGCGGIGTHVAWNMCVLGVGKITLVDFDSVEESNLNRQLLYTMADVGRLKTAVLREKLLSINPNILVNTIDCKIWSEKKLEEVVCSDRYDLILKSLDSPALFPIWLDNVCMRHNIPYISGITVSTTPMIGPTFIPGHSACYADFFDVNERAYQSVSGVSQSLGIVMYHISDEISLEAFRVLTGKGILKYVDCIYTEDVINGKEMVMYPKKSKEHSKEKERPILVACTLMLMLLIVLTAVLTDFVYIMFINFAVCVFLPFIIYRTKQKITRSVLLNFMVFFPLYAVVMLTGADGFSVRGLLEICTAGVSIFSVFSFMIVASQMLVNFLCRKLR